MLVPARTTILFTNSHCVIYSPLDAPHAYAALTSMVGNRQVVIVAPNGMHHMFLDKCRQLFPSAIVISSPCLKQRFPERDFGRTLNDVHGAPLIDGLDDVLAWLVPTKGTLNEIVLLHKPSHTLVLCDWAFNLSDSLVSKMPWFGRIYLYLALRRPCCVSETFKFLIHNPLPVYKTFDSICFQDWDALIMAHGEIIVWGAKQKFRNGTLEFLREMTTPSRFGSNSASLCMLVAAATAMTFGVASIVAQQQQQQ